LVEQTTIAREIAMTLAELTEKLLDIKREKGWSWNHICSEIGGMSPVLIAVPVVPTPLV
jgi:cyanate lyase